MCAANQLQFHFTQVVYLLDAFNIALMYYGNWKINFKFTPESLSGIDCMVIKKLHEHQQQAPVCHLYNQPLVMELGPSCLYGATG